MSALHVDTLVRATGFMTFLLTWLAVFAGATVTSRAGRALSSASISLELHRQASMGALGVGAVHGLVLVSAKGHLPWPGVEAALDAGWLALAVFVVGALAFVLRAGLGPLGWRAVHALAYVGFGAAVVHGVAAGGDTGSVLARGFYLAAVTSVVFVTTWRVLTVRPWLPA
jgi:sulfoxide reductase heme-binding subunit YedZ